MSCERPDDCQDLGLTENAAYGVAKSKPVGTQVLDQGVGGSLQLTADEVTPTYECPSVPHNKQKIPSPEVHRSTLLKEEVGISSRSIRSERVEQIVGLRLSRLLAILSSIALVISIIAVGLFISGINCRGKDSNSRAGVAETGSGMPGASAFEALSGRFADVSSALNKSLLELEAYRTALETVSQTSRKIEQHLETLSLQISQTNRTIEQRLEALSLQVSQTNQTIEQRLEKADSRTHEKLYTILRLGEHFRFIIIRLYGLQQVTTGKTCVMFAWNTAGLTANAGISNTCEYYLNKGFTQSGVYWIRIGNNITRVWCDMDIDGGGWIVIQRRKDGSVDFFRNWTDYKNGFGSLSGEFWLGNRYLHLLTSCHAYELRIDFNDGGYAKYSYFSIANEIEKYKLSLPGFSGSAGVTDELFWHNEKRFSTKDSDNDDLQNVDCAAKHKGGWWYGRCLNSNLNGLYGLNGTRTGILWGWYQIFSLKTFVEMKIRLLKVCV